MILSLLLPVLSFCFFVLLPYVIIIQHMTIVRSFILLNKFILQNFSGNTLKLFNIINSIHKFFLQVCHPNIKITWIFIKCNTILFKTYVRSFNKLIYNAFYNWIAKCNFF